MTQNPLGGTGNVAAAFGGGGLIGNGQGNTLIDQSFSNNLGQSFLIGSNFNSETMPLAGKSTQQPLNMSNFGRDFSPLMPAKMGAKVQN